MESRDVAPEDVLGSETALVVMGEVGVETVDTDQVPPTPTTGQISWTSRTGSVTEGGVHPGTELQGGLLATDTVELVAQYAQHARAVAHHHSHHTRPGETVDRTAGHRALLEVVVGHQVDRGQVQGGLQHTQRGGASRQAAQPGEQEEGEHDLSWDWTDTEQGGGEINT